MRHFIVVVSLLSACGIEQGRPPGEDATLAGTSSPASGEEAMERARKQEHARELAGGTLHHCDFNAYSASRERVIVRSAPAVDAVVVGRLPEAKFDPDLERDIGTEMDVLEARDGWFRIRGYDPSPFVEGWIAGRHLEFDLQTDKVFAAPDSGAAVVATSWDTPDGHISFTWRDLSDCKGKWVNARFTGLDGIERDGWAAGVCGNQDTTCDGVYGERHEHRD